jgi:hypothetical protein
MDTTVRFSNFQHGLVFGFDIGTGSIGYAVRRGSDFIDVGVLICDAQGSNLSKRRDLRRQRRRLRSRKARREWFANELEKLGLHRPATSSDNPIILRLRALKGDPLKPEELHAALAHLFKRRGYSKVPWANLEQPEKVAAKPPKDDDDGRIKEAVKAIRERLAGKHPCEFLAAEEQKVGKSPTMNWARKICWPREALRGEFLAIVQAQKKNFPTLAEKTGWLLYGDSQPKKKGAETFHVFFKTADGRNPGVLGLRWPRFDNRDPALDAFRPFDEQGRPLHVVRKNNEAFIKAQRELALMNFRVLDAGTRQKLDPRTAFPLFIESLRHEWDKKGRVTEARLKKLAEPFKDKFLLIEGQRPLEPETGAGRARYSSPTLDSIRNEIDQGRSDEPPQPILKRRGENAGQALNRYLATVKHPAVKHRLDIFRRLLSEFVSEYGQPDMIIIEAARSLALGRRAKTELNKRNERLRKEREAARKQLASKNESLSRTAILRYRLWQEAKGRCPYCQQTIERTDWGLGAEIGRLVPSSMVDCDEFYNLTVAHIKCNREEKGGRTPFAAFSGTAQWDEMKANAGKCFSGRKLEIFLSPNAAALIEQKSDVQHMAYVARVIRHMSFIQLGWLNDTGRDPTPEKQSSLLRFQVTNSQLTSRLRNAWGLNNVLHPLPRNKQWDELTDEEQKHFTEKNRGDLRRGALNAMVIACTLPWLAHRTHSVQDPFGCHGWWAQDEKLRSKVANPIFPKDGQMQEIVGKEIEKIVVRHHVSRSNHQQAYATTLYAKKAKDTYVAREVFTTLTPKNLGSVWPREFASYCEAAWTRYVEQSADIEAELKKTQGSLPETFTRKLCFSHFQRWRAESAPTFDWPKQIKIPIRNVRLISVKNDTAVVPFSPGTNAYVKRIRFKEVQICLADDETSFVPVFVPYWKKDKPISEKQIKSLTPPIDTIRRGDMVFLKKPSGSKNPPGKYRVVATTRSLISLVPVHIQDRPEPLLAFGYLANGVNIGWQKFFDVAGYELPHSSSVKPNCGTPDQA